MKDIERREDIETLVNAFYSNVRQDSLLAPVFEQRVGDRWEAHLPKMYQFWETVLLEERTYFGSPFPPHRGLGIGQEHFKRWLELWKTTVFACYEGDKATEAVWRAEKMAEMFSYKLEAESGGNLGLV